ncbi:MAG: glycosyltransferase [Gallionellaceae bacterium]
MSKSPRFNYIITIHNKEDLIEKVVMSVLMCCRDNSYIYTVIDGCTDRTEEIIDGIISTYSGVPIIKVHTADVHELLSINAGLKSANQDEDGYNIILQDDVILADFLLESKVIALYEWAGPKLGYVSFRLGANFLDDAATSTSSVPLTDFVENAYGHGLQDAKVLLSGHFVYRSVPIKSPVCYPSKLVRMVGMFNEQLAPYGHDDTELSIRLIKAGYRNGVFGVKFLSKVEWGGTRTTPHPELNKNIIRNMNVIRQTYKQDIINICSSKQSSDMELVPGMSSDTEVQLAKIAWNLNKNDLAVYQGHGHKNIALKIIQKIKKILTN